MSPAKEIPVHGLFQVIPEATGLYGHIHRSGPLPSSSHDSSARVQEEHWINEFSLIRVSLDSCFEAWIFTSKAKGVEYGNQECKRKT